MTRISEFLAADHRRCDALWEQALAAFGSGDWEGCRAALDAFAAALARHMAVEEEKLFPAFETATGITGGPTRVMRYEHQQMTALLEQARDAAAARDPQRLRDAAESFGALMSSHSAKEENVLYPMCDEALPETSGESLFAAEPAPGGLARGGS